jgi:NADH:ubiquinone oxidoreductase subunit
MVADYLWMRMIQYYAFHMRSDMKYEYLYPITDRLTDLDPKFLYPYTFGSLLLIHDAQDSVNCLKLLDKAKKMNPDKWQFPYMKGFILYVFLRRGDEAVKEFVEASKLPKAWEGALRYAAWISRKQGQRETSKRMWQELYDKSTNKNERAVAKFYLDKIYIDEEVDRYQSLADKYHKNTGKWPESLDDLKAAGLVRDIKKDLFGGEFYWNAEQNQVRNTTQDAYLRKIGKLK